VAVAPAWPAEPLGVAQPATRRRQYPSEACGLIVLNDDSGLSERVEDSAVEQLVAKAPVEALDVTGKAQRSVQAWALHKRGREGAPSSPKVDNPAERSARYRRLPIRVMNASQEPRPKAKPPPRPTSWRLQSQRRLPEGPRCTPSPWVTVEDGRERLRGANLINLTHPTSID
jgi:hypothetical protein